MEISTGYPNTQGDDETDAANYRPISLLSIPSKILESVVNDALVTHVFVSNDLASNRQWAFRKGFSTKLLLTQLTELWRKEVDKGNAVAVAFIDFKKAFDCVQHDQLLTKLQDDTTIYCVAENGDQAIHQLNKALKELYSWCLINRITPHPKKSEIMLKPIMWGQPHPLSSGVALSNW